MWSTTNCTKINNYLQTKSVVDAIIITDPAYLAYVTGLNLQILFSRKSLCVALLIMKKNRYLVCPKILASSYVTAGWKDSIMTYADCVRPQETAMTILANCVKLFLEDKAKIGYLSDLMSEKMFSQLQRELPVFEFVNVSDDLKNMREIKSDFELNNLALAAKYADHGIAGAIHHVARNVGKTEKFLTEDIRVHSIERGLHVEGYRAISQSVSEDHARKIWPNAPFFGVGRDSIFFEGKFIRLEMCGMYNGYWTNDSRILVKSNVVNVEQAEFIRKMTELRKYACNLICPGIRAANVFHAVKDKAAELGLQVHEELGFGHGIGVEPVESPYLCASDETILAENMVLVLSLAAHYLIDDEILITRDTLFLTKDGCRIVGWYENWDSPYTTAFTF